MTVIDQHLPLPRGLTVEPTSTIAFDAYRDIHKGIRAELFAVTATAGNTDPSDRQGRAALSAHVFELVELLDEHAGQEDTHILPVLKEHATTLFDRNATDHVALDARPSMKGDPRRDRPVGPHRRTGQRHERRRAR